MTRRTKVLRPLDWSFPPAAVERELLHQEPEDPADRPPLLFVHGMNHGAWCWEEHWMPAAAERGWDCWAVSVRAHGASGGHDRLRRWTVRDYEHDVMQAITQLPAPPVLVGHSMGAHLVRRVLARYAAAAAVLLAPSGPRSGLGPTARMVRRRPKTLLRGALALPVLLDEGDLFGPEMPRDAARRYAARMTPEPPLAQAELALRAPPARAQSPVLVVGGSEDALVSVSALVRTARLYGARAHVFRGMGHDLMLEPRWREPLDLVLDWSERVAKAD